MKGAQAIMGLTAQAKQSLIRESYQGYQVSGTKDKTKILDEVSEITGLNRTYLLHLLANGGERDYECLPELGVPLPIPPVPPLGPDSEVYQRIAAGLLRRPCHPDGIKN
jgi:hypothetical protein